MTKSLQQINVAIPAGTVAAPGIWTEDVGGGFLFIVAASQEFGLRFDNDPVFNTRSGYKFTQNFQKLTFFNYTTGVINVRLDVGQAGVGYDGANECKDALSYGRGQLGITNATFAGGFTAGYITSGWTNPWGAGYKVNDLLTVAGGTLVSGASPAQVKVTSVSSNGGVSAVELVNGGQYTVLPTSPNNLTGGAGSGVAFYFSSVAPVSGLTINSDGTLSLASGAFLPLAGFDASGNRRRQIVFRCTSGTLYVRDSNGCLFSKIASGASPETYFTCSNFTVDGGGAAVSFVIGESFYQ